MTTAAIPPGTLLAEHATIATQAGTCTICRWPIRIGERVARLTVLAAGTWAHTGCTSRITARVTAARPARR